MSTRRVRPWTPNYLLRFDDLCDQSNWQSWRAIEAVLDDHGVRPIVAVVPDVADPDLVRGPRRPDFWSQVRDWQAKGWTIGLHGHRHQLDSASRGLVGYRPASEFAGHPHAVQFERLSAAVAAFGDEGVIPDVWVAPNHTFDELTLNILRTLGIYQVSDGLGLFPWLDDRLTWWIPQQLWTWRPMPSGVWTICLHPNGWGTDDVRGLDRFLRRRRHQVTDVDTVRRRYGNRHRTIADSAAAGAVRVDMLARRAAAKVLRA